MGGGEERTWRPQSSSSRIEISFFRATRVRSDYCRGLPALAPTPAWECGGRTRVDSSPHRPYRPCSTRSGCLFPRLGPRRAFYTCTHVYRHGTLCCVVARVPTHCTTAYTCRAVFLFFRSLYDGRTCGHLLRLGISYFTEDKPHALV